MFEELYRQNRGLLWTLANHWREACERDRAVSVDDLAQAGFFGLVNAAQTFDPAAGKPWTSWAAWYITREICAALGYREGRPTKAHTSALALDAPLSEDAEGATLGDSLENKNLPEIDSALLFDEVQRGIRAAVEQLTDEQQRRAIQLHDLGGVTQIETARRLGVSVDRVRRLRRAGHDRLRHNRQLRALADEQLDERTKFHAHKGVAAFERDWTSVTEGAALWRVEQQQRLRPWPHSEKPEALRVGEVGKL